MQLLSVHTPSMVSARRLRSPCRGRHIPHKEGRRYAQSRLVRTFDDRMSKGMSKGNRSKVATGDVAKGVGLNISPSLNRNETVRPDAFRNWNWDGAKETGRDRDWRTTQVAARGCTYEMRHDEAPTVEYARSIND